jgi:hypothetical protein
MQGVIFDENKRKTSKEKDNVLRYTLIFRDEV